MRLFIAILLEDKTKVELSRVQNKIKTLAGKISASWVQSENFHITLKFLGDQPPEIIPDISMQLDKAGGSLQCFSFDINGLGAFPNVERPSVLWAGINNGKESLQKCADTVELCLQVLNFKPESKSYHAHITLARIKGYMNGLQNIYNQINETSCGTVKVNSLSLMESVLTPYGSIYKEISKHPLKTKEDGGALE